MGLYLADPMVTSVDLCQNMQQDIERGIWGIFWYWNKKQAWFQFVKACYHGVMHSMLSHVHMLLNSSCCLTRYGTSLWPLWCRYAPSCTEPAACSHSVPEQQVLHANGSYFHSCNKFTLLILLLEPNKWLKMPEE